MPTGATSRRKQTQLLPLGTNQISQSVNCCVVCVHKIDVVTEEFREACMQTCAQMSTCSRRTQLGRGSVRSRRKEYAKELHFNKAFLTNQTLEAGFNSDKNEVKWHRPRQQILSIGKACKSIKRNQNQMKTSQESPRTAKDTLKSLEGNGFWEPCASSENATNAQIKAFRENRCAAAQDLRKRMILRPTRRPQGGQPGARPETTGLILGV